MYLERADLGTTKLESVLKKIHKDDVALSNQLQTVNRKQDSAVSSKIDCFKVPHSQIRSARIVSKRLEHQFSANQRAEIHAIHRFETDNIFKRENVKRREFSFNLSRAASRDMWLIT